MLSLVDAPDTAPDGRSVAWCDAGKPTPFGENI